MSPPVEKLVPEWRLGGDDQIILIGIGVFLLMLGGLGVNRWISSDDAASDATAIEEVESASGGGDTDGDAGAAGDANSDGDDASLTGSIVAAAAGTGAAADDDDADADAADDVEPEPEAEAEPEPDAEPEAEAPQSDLPADVAAAVGPFSRVDGAVDGTTAVLTGFVDTDEQSTDAETAASDVDGITAVDNQLMIVAPGVDSTLAAYPGVENEVTDGAVTLTGFVDTDDESSEAETAAAAVDGVESVDNQLVAVDADVVAALTEAGVTDASTDVALLSATVRGEIADESARQPALDAAGAVPGVVSVVDELTVAGPSVSDRLNELVELEPVQFATNSAVVLESSFPTLDAAADIILDSAVDGVIDIQGYTDIRGNADANLELSEARAAAVLDYLVGAGVDPAVLTSQGFGGTTQFGDGETAADFAANRRVVFVPEG